ncbi:MoaD/ThiS family protein [Rubinisphaera margarita]|uniref:MoaD/ThiS family protein n=1 Tax=Rubinisphaera margarita TaxID=2909586 RepID=UPI001EE84EB9|nr:MoaD/ThiS family protein [Rubinisphaera margarita]MCG6157938.1 MoaD/ThiS family protein [Rubinisphaera margarita]
MPSTANITVRFFAQLKEVAGTGETQLICQQAMRIADVKQQIADEYPLLAPYLKSVFTALNGSYCGGETEVNPGDEIAFIPPVSGG